MNTIRISPNEPYSVLRIGEAWRNRPGLATLIMTALVVVLLLAVGGAMARFSAALVVLFGGLATIAYLVGICAAGVQFMDQAATRPVSSISAAFAASPMVVLRSVGLGIVLLLCWLAFYAVEALVLFVCKIPGVGALLYAVAFPALVLINALVFVAFVVAVSLAFPALCEGHSLKTSLSQLWAVVAQRPVEAILNLVVLFICFAFVVGTVSFFIAVGFMNTSMVSVAILKTQVSGDFGSLMGGFSGGGFGGSDGSSGLVAAGIFGASVVFGIAGALFSAMSLLGLSLTYLKVTAGLDVTAARAAMEGAIAKTKEMGQQAAEEAKRRAHDAQVAAQARMEQARASQALRAAPQPSATLSCSACKASVLPDELFCGSCGHRLKQ